LNRNQEQQLAFIIYAYITYLQHVVPAQEQSDVWVGSSDSLAYGELLIGDDYDVLRRADLRANCLHVCEELCVGGCQLSFMDEVSEWDNWLLIKIGVAE